MDNKYILAINPGSTSTKIALFLSEKKILSSNIPHSSEEISKFPKIIDQKDFRSKIVSDFLEKNSFNPKHLSAVVGRGGLLSPMKSGTYIVNQKMIDYLATNSLEHASNLGAIIADSIAKLANVNAFIVDPVVVDEMDETAKITGIPEIKRKSIWHALNQKSAGREAAKLLNKKYKDCNLIIVHLGGGISIAAHKKGLAVDVNNALNGDGPFSPERAGSIPAWSLVELVKLNKYTFTDIKKMIAGKGGIVAHLKTNDLREVENRISENDKKAELIYNAMAYNISKSIGAMGPVFRGDIDAIVLTGGIAYSKKFVDLIKSRVEFLARVLVLPGEDEMGALVKGVLRVLNGKEKAKIWKN